MLAIDSTGHYIAASAYEDRLALFSVSMSAGSNIIDQKLYYPPENQGDAGAGSSIHKTSISGTIWSMCFINYNPRKNGDPALAILLNRRKAILNELLLLGWDVKGRDLYLISQYVETGPLALSVVEVPHLYGFALLFRAGDVLLMDLRNSEDPCCVYRTSLNILAPAVEELDFIEEPCSGHDIIIDDEGSFNDAACALLKLRDHDPMCIDEDITNVQLSARFACSWSWEPENDRCPRMIFCLDTGEFFMIEVSWDYNIVDLSECLYKGLPTKELLWLEGGYLAAIVEMGDGSILKLDNGKLISASTIQNIAPILDMSLADFHDEKQDQMFVSCGVAPEGSLRIIRNGINVEKLLRTAPIYQGISGTWTLKMKLADAYHSFVVLSFVEETRVLSVGVSFTDVTDSVGFEPDVCTLASGLVGDGLLIQIHQNAVRLCLPTKTAHPEGISLSSPVCTSWLSRNTSISMGAVGKHFIVVSTSNPCVLIILGVRLLSAYNYEIFELQHLSLQNEVSCISIPQKYFEQKQSASGINMDICEAANLPSGVHIESTFVIGTHKPSVEVLSLLPDRGLRVIASGTISLTNTMGTAISGCIPQDVRLVLVDRLYVLSGLRNGMLLRLEWPTASWMLCSELFHPRSSMSSYAKTDRATLGMKLSNSSDRQIPSLNLSGQIEESRPTDLQLIATRRIGITPVFLVPLSDALDADIIALSDRPWLLQTARHSLSYTSVSFQPSTHVTPVCSAECPGGVLFVAENSLHLVEMVHSKRLNVQKFHIGGTPRKVLYHSESRLLLVLRTELSNDSCSSDICCVDPHSGAVLSAFKLEPEEIAKSMELVKVGNEHVVVIGTSLSSGPAIMPSGEAERAKGRLIVLYLEQVQSTDGSSVTFCSKPGSSSQRTSPLCEIAGYATEHLSASSFCSSPDDASIEGIKLEENEGWQLRLAYATEWAGMVLAVCPYLDRYFLASAGNAFYVCSFANDNPQKVKRHAVSRTRFMITSLRSYFTRIAVGDCRDGILFYSYHEEARKLEQDYCDPSQRLVADCTLMDADTAVVSDRKGSIAVLSCPDRTEDNASPESNLTVSCAYYMGEIAMSIRKGSFSYKLPAEDGLRTSDGPLMNMSSMQNIIIASTLLGSIIILVPISREEHQLLQAVQAKLAIHPLTAPVLGNDHNEFRSSENLVATPKILDGDMLSQFLELTSMQQEAVLSLPLSSPDTVKLNSQPYSPISVNQVVQMLEQVHYALN
ncbi:splicing factor 3B subunit 3 isoform X2 [Punica granatum]|nr:splicing factor 3B subunit 3 isoform X2 [Punica granatum]